jgi:hypothetical protein
MKIIVSILFLIVSAELFAQERIVVSKDHNISGIAYHSSEFLSKPKEITLSTDSTEYNYFAAYLVIQTSDVTTEQLDFTKKLMKYVKQNHGILYITIQSGVPPCIPTPGHPCPKQ